MKNKKAKQEEDRIVTLIKDKELVKLTKEQRKKYLKAWEEYKEKCKALSKIRI